MADHCWNQLETAWPLESDKKAAQTANVPLAPETRGIVLKRFPTFVDSLCRQLNGFQILASHEPFS